MLQTKSDRFGPSRTNVNLEGLYDSRSAEEDIHLDLGQGSDTPVIKLEDLSENVRNQIMSIIGEGINSDMQTSVGQDAQSPGVNERIVPVHERLQVDHLINRDKSSPYARAVSLEEQLDPSKKNSNKQKVPPPTRSLNSNRGIVDPSGPKGNKSDEGKASEPSISRKKSSKVNSSEIGEDGRDAKKKSISKKSNTYEADANTSLTLNAENVISKYPTIMGEMSGGHRKTKTGDDLADANSNEVSLEMSTLQLASGTAIPEACSLQPNLGQDKQQEDASSMSSFKTNGKYIYSYDVFMGNVGCQ